MPCSSTSLMIPNCDAIAPMPAVNGLLLPDDDEPDGGAGGVSPPPARVCLASCALVSAGCNCSDDGSSTLSTVTHQPNREKPCSSNFPHCSFSNLPKPFSMNP